MIVGLVPLVIPALPAPRPRLPFITAKTLVELRLKHLVELVIEVTVALRNVLPDHIRIIPRLHPLFLARSPITSRATCLSKREGVVISRGVIHLRIRLLILLKLLIKVLEIIPRPILCQWGSLVDDFFRVAVVL